MKFCRNIFVIFSIMFLWSQSGYTEQTLVLYDDFSGNITDNWTVGRSLNQTQPHALTIEEGKLKWVQSFDYIESKLTFGNDLMIQFDYSTGPPASFQYADFWIELTGLTNAEPPHYMAGIYRAQYGSQNYHAINIGRAPSVTTSVVADKVLDPPYLKQLEPGSPREGRITLTYSNQNMRISFENNEAKVIHTDWVPTGSFTETRVRIWGMGSSGGPRYIHHIKIYAPSGTVDPGQCKPRVVVIPLFD